LTGGKLPRREPELRRQDDARRRDWPCSAREAGAAAAENQPWPAGTARAMAYFVGFRKNLGR